MGTKPEFDPTRNTSRTLMVAGASAKMSPYLTTTREQN